MLQIGSRVKIKMEVIEFPVDTVGIIVEAGTGDDAWEWCVETELDYREYLREDFY
jgi:hypothetical protein